MLISATSILKGGKLGIGTNDPGSAIHVYENNANVDYTTGITIEQDGTGDAVLHFELTGGGGYNVGIDNSANDLFIISGGKSQNIKPGKMFNIVLEGKKIKNPQTNMLITLPGRKVGVLKVAQCVGDTVQNEVSLCSLVSGDLNIYKDTKDFSKLFIREIEGK